MDEQLDQEFSVFGDPPDLRWEALQAQVNMALAAYDAQVGE